MWLSGPDIGTIASLFYTKIYKSIPNSRHVWVVCGLKPIPFGVAGGSEHVGYRDHKIIDQREVTTCGRSIPIYERTPVGLFTERKRFDGR